MARTEQFCKGECQCLGSLSTARKDGTHWKTAKTDVRFRFLFGCKQCDSLQSNVKHFRLALRWFGELESTLCSRSNFPPAIFRNFHFLCTFLKRRRVSLQNETVENSFSKFPMTKSLALTDKFSCFFFNWNRANLKIFEIFLAAQTIWLIGQLENKQNC